MLNRQEPHSGHELRKAFLAIFLILGFLVFLKLWPGPTHPGPIVEGLRSEGVFKPGGFVKLIIEPDFTSIHSLYKGEIKAEPVLTNIQKEKGIKWDIQTFHVGSSTSWGKEISTGPLKKEAIGQHEKILPIEISLSIPKEPLLTKENILLKITGNLICPMAAGEYSFTNKNITMNKEIEIIIENSDLTAFEIFYSQYMYPVLLVMMLVIIVILEIRHRQKNQA